MEIQKKEVELLPQSPGIYIFKNSERRILYVGKAINLLRRVRSYFQDDVRVGPKIAALRNQIKTIDYRLTASEFDAILLEVNFIQKYSPPYNSIAKDDKSPLYIVISLSEQLPHIVFVRKTYLGILHKKDTAIGPFQSAKTARKLASTLRMAIPFCTQKQRTGKACFYTHIGLCKPCPSEIKGVRDELIKKQLTQIYRKNMIRLSNILQGKSREVIHDLEKNMKVAASSNNFELAGLLKKQVESLISIHARHHDPMTYEKYSGEDTFGNEMTALITILKPHYPTLRDLHRIECIDISNLGPTHATGSLVVLEDGYPASSEYRKFRIRLTPGPNDVSMVQEVLHRRLNHPEWTYPDLLVIDGGKPQVQAAQAVLKDRGIDIPLIGLSKRYEEIVIFKEPQFIVIRLPLGSHALYIIQRIRDEAHRFAKSYHILLRRSKELTANIN